MDKFLLYGSIIVSCTIVVQSLSHFPFFHPFHQIHYNSGFHPFLKNYPFFDEARRIDYNLELCKPIAQNSQSKVVPLHLIPESTFHIIEGGSSRYGASSNPAVRIPLEKPLILQSTESRAIVPSAYTIFYHGTMYPFLTQALIAPISETLFVSEDAPIILNVVYAIAKFNPAYFPVSNQNNNISKKVTNTIPSISTTEIPNNDTVVISSLKDSKAEDSSIDTNIPFSNSKESPYLQQLRLESLQRQVEELQAQIRKLKSLKY